MVALCKTKQLRKTSSDDFFLVEVVVSLEVAAGSDGAEPLCQDAAEGPMHRQERRGIKKVASITRRTKVQFPEKKVDKLYYSAHERKRA